MTPGVAKALMAALPGQVTAAIGAALDTVADAAAAEARRLLGEAVQQPSPAGAPPADPSGALACAVATARADEGAVHVVVAAPFAQDLEFGTRHMAARPFLRPAVASTGAAARVTLADALSQTVAATLDDTT